MTIIDILGVVGTLLGVGAALDAAVKADVKVRLTEWLTNISASTSTYGYRGSIFLDRVFGMRLLSFQAMSRYMGISLVSMAISYFIALVTTPPTPDGNLSLFPAHVSPLALTLLAICVVFAMLGDVASYSITRLFIRTVDAYQARIVSVGLVVADIITSLSLFFISFSIARVICYTLVLYIVPLPKLEVSTPLFQDAIASQMKAFGPAPTIPSRTSSTALGLLVANGQTDEAMKQIASLTRARAWPEGSPSSKSIYIDYLASRMCLDRTKISQEYFSAMEATRNLMVSVANEQNSVRSSPMTSKDVEAILASHTEALLDGNAACNEHLLTITESIDVRHFISVMGPGNTYLAAFERTLYDAYQLVGFKFSPYIAFDPNSGIGEFLQSLRTMSTTTVLGATDPEPQRAKIADMFGAPLGPVPRLINVPFSPMAASSLTSSFFFLSYLAILWLALARRAVGRAISWAIPRFDLDKAVFTTLGVAVATLFCATLATGLLVSTAWNLIFG